MRIRLPVVTASLIALGAPSTKALADSRPASVGPYAQVGMGGRKLVGKTKRRAAIGTNFELHVGTDLFKWLSVGGRFDIASHEATVPAPPEGEYMQFYSASGEARLSLSLGRLNLYAEGTLGYGMVSTNILEKVHVLDPGERFSPALGAGGGLEYQLQNRHYAFGAGGSWTMFPKFARMHTVSALAHLRYTY